MIRVGVNGFGRIGRQVVKAFREHYPDTVEIVAFNDLGDLNTMAHLFRYDSNYGRFLGTVEVSEKSLIVDGLEIKAFAERDPSAIPWGDLGVSIVIESTGIFTTGTKAHAHLKGGAKKVIISAPALEVDATLVMGVNEQTYDGATHHIVSNPSCTTNCLAPLAKILLDAFGIQKATITAIHSFTTDQRILDAPHKDLRRARTASTNIVPTTTGAVKALPLVIPELNGKFEGVAVRVPTPTGSLLDFVGTMSRDLTTDELHETLQRAAEGRLKGIVGFEKAPLVSSDIIHDSRSAIVDADFTMAFGGNMVKMLAWYDNEWGYSCRTADLAYYIGQQLA